MRIRSGGRRLQIAVAGGGACDRPTARLARAVGRELAAARAVMVCGGLGGVMAAAARGAAEAGGTVVGILPGSDASAGNRHLSIAIPTGLGHARNVLVVAAGDAVIALPGGPGTLSEVALARVLGRPVVGLGAWGSVPGVIRARSAAAAVRRALGATRDLRSQSRRGDGVPVPPCRRRLRSRGMALIFRGRRRSQ